jgi:hypothetical protein
MVAVFMQGLFYDTFARLVYGEESSWSYSQDLADL